MTATRSVLSFLRCTALVTCFLPFAASVLASPKAGTSCWQVDSVRVGMRGYGRTVMHGTRVESFDVEVLGVLKNTSPGRDMVLCRLSGLNLEKYGVIAGMSGSPVYLNGKLLGAVAYAWPFGKEPIAGVTPFCQMHGFVESYERRDLAEKKKPRHVGLLRPITVDGKHFDTVTVSGDDESPTPTAADGLWMVPLRTPLCASGFTAHSLRLLKQRCQGWGIVPVQGGAASASIADQERLVDLEPGGPLAVALVRGDFDMSGIGTVTHIDGGRVYGWGHPFFGLGACQFPLMTGYIHTVFPRQTVSFKMGSPLRTVGVINADVSTCIAGWLHRKPDMLPMSMTVTRETGPASQTRTFNVEVARQDSLLASLVYTVLTNSVDMEGELPEELTAELCARIDVEGHDPIVLKDTFSGLTYGGGRAPQSLYNQVATLVNQLVYNTYKPVRINRIDCETRLLPGRQTADIDSIELSADTYSPGETLKATVFLKPYKGLPRRIPVILKLPADLPDGTYSAVVCDDVESRRRDFRNNPYLSNPQSLEQVFEGIRVQTSIKRTDLKLRVPLRDLGVAVDGKTLPDLPPSMVQLIGNTRRTGAQPLGGALVSRKSTPWVIQGMDSARFTVARNKSLHPDP